MHLAQLNIGRIVASIDDPIMTEFAGNLDRINSLAEASPGFVWRLRDEDSPSSTTGDATTFALNGDPQSIPNLSVWESIDQLKAFVYSPEHIGFLQRRTEWFEVPTEAHFAMWWIDPGHRPTLDEALERLEQLRSEGPTSEAFTFARMFEPS